MKNRSAAPGRTAVRPILVASFVLLQITLLAFPRHDTLDLEAWPNTRLSPRIAGAATVGQSFVSGRNGLSRVDVFLATYAAAPPGDVIFRLFEGDPTGAPLAEVRVPGSSLRDNLFNPFAFRRISRSRGKHFSFTLSASAAAESQGPSLWMNSADLLPQGTLLVDGRPASGDAVFRTYSRRTILAEWGRIARGTPGFLGHPLLLGLAAAFFISASALAFRHILGLLFKKGEAPDA